MEAPLDDRLLAFGAPSDRSRSDTGRTACGRALKRQALPGAQLALLFGL